MDIILNDDVVGVGEIGERVKVRAGFARNFLIPRGLAFEASSASAKHIAHRMRIIDSKKNKLKGLAEGKAGEIRNLTLEFELRVGSTGKVFGSISNRDIADKLAEAGYELDRRRVVLDEPIRKLGTHFARVKLHSDVEAQVKVEVTATEATQEDEDTETRSAIAAFERQEESGYDLNDDFDGEESDLDS